MKIPLRDAAKLARSFGLAKPPECWTCEHVGDISPMYPLFNYCKKAGKNVVGYGCKFGGEVVVAKTETTTKESLGVAGGAQ